MAVSTYTNRPLPELHAVKGHLLAAIGGACDETAEQLAAHLDAIEVELGRRIAPMARRERMEVDEDGGVLFSISYHCPACDGRCRPNNPFCPTCGQGIRKAA